MRYSRFSAAWVGVLLVPGLVFSACSDDATTSGAEPCSGADCGGAGSGTAGSKADNTGGKAVTTGGSANQSGGGEAAAGETSSVDPSAGSPSTSGGAGGAGGASGADNGNTASGAGGQAEQVELSGPGSACEDEKTCASGHCSDGVCCDESCDDGCFSCKGSDTGGADGVCLPVIAGTDAAGDCEPDAATCQAGVCNGSGACKKADDGTVCRPADGDCDVADVCTNGACGADAVKAPETSCRAQAGVCDLAELCNGLDKTCPSDVFSSASVEACPGYKCTGASASCPTSCATKADCSPARFCHENQCVVGKRVFLTSTTHAANFGALTNADAVCNARAQAAGLFGTYMAWVSSTTSNIAARSAHSTFMYYRMDGTTPVVVAANWADLIDGTTVAIATDENGTVRGYESVFTGTEYNGVVAANNCSNWSTVAANVTFATGNSSAGAGQGAPNWSHYWDYNCSTLGRFYCIQQ